jgi:competence protein ComEA
MRTTRWLAAIVVSAWCLTGGAAWSADDTTHLAPAKAHAHADGKVNINEADQTELMKLEGVGAGMAKKIIAWRDAHGPFKRAQDLEKVPGVGKAVLDKNHGRIAVK